MKNNTLHQEKQYAKVARVFPKTVFNTTYAKIKVLDTNKSLK